MRGGKLFDGLIDVRRLEQDLDEAKTTVEKRLQYIGDEMSVPFATLTNRHSSPKVRHKYNTLKKHHRCRKRTQKHLTDLENNCEEKKVKMMQLQQQLRKPPPKADGVAE
jgi:hypothetical protein